MRRVTLLLLISTLMVSLAAPTGAAFATTGEVAALGEVSELEAYDNDMVLGAEAETDHHIETPYDLIVEPTELTEESLLAEVIEPPEDEGTDEPIGGDEEGDGSEGDTPIATYPPIIISELQVAGSCDGGDWCTEGNVEFIELYNPNEFDVSLEGWQLRRQATGSNSQPTDYITFSETGIFSGEYVLVSTGLVAPVDVAIVAELPSNLSNTGGSLFLVAPDGEVVDMVGWGSSAKSYYGAPADAPSSNQSIQRCLKDGLMYELSPRDNSEEMLVYQDLGPTPGMGIECVMPPAVNLCEGVRLSEVAANVDNQFIELHNPGDVAVSLEGCQLQTNRSTTRAFIFPDGVELEPSKFLFVLIDSTNLTLTKTTFGVVYMLSSDGGVEVDSVPYENLAKDTSWSFVEGGWVQTYRLTPGEANVYERYLPCEQGYWRNEETGRCNRIAEPVVLADCGEGRERNPATGRCRNIPAPRQLAPCLEGQYRSEETNRCRSIALAAARVLRPCADDQFRNPATNRCKKIASQDDIALADCGEGRERNPETNRCRNVVANLASLGGAPFPVESVGQDQADFIGWWTLGLVAIAGVGYGIWEWRSELKNLMRRLLGLVAPRK